MDHQQGISFLLILLVGFALAASIEFLPDDGVRVEDADHVVGEMALRRYLDEMRPSKGVPREKRQAPEAEVATSADAGADEATSPSAAPPAGRMSTTADAPSGPRMTAPTTQTAERAPGNGTSRCGGGFGGFGGAGFFPGVGFPGVGFPGVGVPGVGTPGVGVGVPGMGIPSMGVGVPGMGIPGIGLPIPMGDGGMGMPGPAGGVTVNGVPTRMGLNRPVMPMNGMGMPMMMPMMG